MADFNKWQLETLAPGWLRGPLGEGLALAMGHMKDAFAQAARQAVKARFPLLAPADALPSIGADRMLERMPPETEPSYSARLVAAWDAWAKGGTVEGITDAIALTGLCTAIVYNTFEADLGPGSWARFIVVLSGHPWSGDGVWGDPPPWGDGGTWGSTALVSEVDLIRRQVAKWKGAHALCLGIIVPLGGEIWGIPPGGLWSDPSTWGGESATWLPLPEGTNRMSWVDQVFKWLGYGQYNSTPPVLTEGQVGPFQTDVNGNLKVNLAVGTVTAGEAAAASVAQTTAPASSGIVKASAGSLVEIVGWNESPDDRYLILRQAATVPADATATTTTAFRIIKVAGGAAFSYSPPRPLVFSTGIVWVCSSTRATVTASADFYLFAQYL